MLQGSVGKVLEVCNGLGWNYPPPRMLPSWQMKMSCHPGGDCYWEGGTTRSNGYSQPIPRWVLKRVSGFLLGAGR